MKTRSEIKSLAKASMKQRYWLAVLALLLFSFGCTALASIPLASLLLIAPVSIGMNFLFVNIFMQTEAMPSQIFNCAFDNYGRKLGGYLWMLLHLFLWSLIPVAGFIMVIIKGFAYSQINYILCDCPNVTAKDAMKLSRRMMMGNKWRLFVFFLSFLGWDILSCFTCGLLQIFYVAPFKATARAGWYLELREAALANGVVTADELNGVVPAADFNGETPTVETETELLPE